MNNDGMFLLWIIFISFSMILHNVTLLPKLNGELLKSLFAITTLGISIIMIYFVFVYTGFFKKENKK